MSTTADVRSLAAAINPAVPRSTPSIAASSPASTKLSAKGSRRRWPISPRLRASRQMRSQHGWTNGPASFATRQGE